MRHDESMFDYKPLETCVYCGGKAESLDLDIYGLCHRECHDRRLLKGWVLAILFGLTLILMVVISNIIL
jgi:hypothetical protein